MSRSYKKNPWVTDHKRKTTKQSKRLANKTFRRKIGRENDMAARPQHKKYTDSYDICDWKMRMTREEAINFYLYECDDFNPYIKRRYPTLKSWLNYWEKCYHRK